MRLFILETYHKGFIKYFVINIVQISRLQFENEFVVTHISRDLVRRLIPVRLPSQVTEEFVTTCSRESLFKYRWYFMHKTHFSFPIRSYCHPYFPSTYYACLSH